MLTAEQLAEGVHVARERMEREKLRYYNGCGSYDEMAEAAKGLAKLLNAYMQAKHPSKHFAPVRWQSLTR